MDEQLAALKESWRTKKATWKTKRQPGSWKKKNDILEDGFEEEKESEAIPYVEEPSPKKHTN